MSCVHGMSPLTTAAAPHGVASSEIVATTLVDRALESVGGRRCTTREEAISLLDQVRANVGDTGLRAAVTSVVNDALLVYRRDQLVDKWRVIDPLLDIRLILGQGRSGQSLP